MDVVYLCQPGQNEELRYSLRSLVNLPHDEVWIAGDAPAWYRGNLLKVKRRGSKWEQTTANLVEAVGCADISDEFVVMNDDFFVMKPVDELPVFHRGPIRRHIEQARGSYKMGLSQLLRWWKGPELLSYELHVPMTLTKAGVRVVLDSGCPPFPRDAAKRTLYGNLNAVGGSYMRDVKILARDQPFDSEATYLSTNEFTFNREPVGAFIRERFPDPSQWEAA